jgi:hypothetical protein
MTSFLPDMFGFAGDFFGWFHHHSIHIHTIWGPIGMGSGTDLTSFFHGFFGFFR